ncbi:MAG: protein kinase [Myxococcota bacterium]
MSLYVDELFQELSELPIEEREHAIVERCKGDPAAEAQVRALLSAEAEMERPVAIATGTMLGPYRLERKLGEGATASVWQAWDTHLRAFTALKLLHPENVRGDGALQVVLHEARAASSIISDHVVRIKTAGRVPGGPPFIEMELCAEYEPTDDGSEALTTGQSLSEVTLQSLAEKVRVVAEAARGVEAAHRIGVLHRDLKPGNILLTPVSRRAKVTDFGLAADQVYPAPTAGTAANRTVTVQTDVGKGAIVGTPAYMPPEQARGEPPSRTTDVYALGATLYALIVGDHPYLAAESARVPALDVLAQVKRGPPVRLRRRARVPRRLARIVERAMHRTPRRRYPTAVALAQDLEAWLNGYATAVDGTAPLLRVGLFVARHRTAAVTVGLLLVTLVAFGAAVGFLEQRRRDLTADIDEARVTMGDYRKQVSDFEDEVAEAATQLADTQADLKDAERAHQQALLSESAAERRYRVELEQRRAAEEQSAALTASLEELRLLRDEALADLEAANLTVEGLQAEGGVLRASLADTTARLADMEARLGLLEAEFEAMRIARDQALEALAAREAELAEARSSIETLPAEGPPIGGNPAAEVNEDAMVVETVPEVP